MQYHWLVYEDFMFYLPDHVIPVFGIFMSIKSEEEHECVTSPVYVWLICTEESYSVLTFVHDLE